MSKEAGPKILILDIETSPVIADVWKLWKNDIGLNQIKQDWEIIAWGAKWYGENKISYRDLRSSTKSLTANKELIRPIRDLMDEANIIVTQNGKQFDIKRINAKCIELGIKPPSSYQNIDTLEIAQRKFGFTSNKLEYLTNKLNVKYKKLKHDRYPGHELWAQCLKGNQDAWKEMEKYNKYDVLSLEELFPKFMAWTTGEVNFGVYSGSSNKCFCGSTKFHRNGYVYSKVGKYQRYSCAGCGHELKDRRNILTRVLNPDLKVGA